MVSVMTTANAIVQLHNLADRLACLRLHKYDLAGAMTFIHVVSLQVSNVVQKKRVYYTSYAPVGIFRFRSPESEQLRWSEQELWYELVVSV